jgi:hypothetical protein
MCYRDAEFVAHPRKIIMSILNIQLLSSFRFLIIGLTYVISLGNLEYTPSNFKDFGFIPLG